MATRPHLQSLAQRIRLGIANGNAPSQAKHILRRRKHRTALGSDKLFGKYDELTRLVLGFVLTGILGTYLSHRYTTQQADLAAAGKVFNEHSKLIGERHFAMTQLTAELREAQALPSGTPLSESARKWAAYRTIVQEWNSVRGFNREMIRLYFGDKLWNSERNVHYLFRAWGQSLEAEQRSRGSIDFACLDKKVDEVLVLTHQLRVEMAQAMQLGKVGAARDKDPAIENPRPELLCPVKTRP